MSSSPSPKSLPEGLKGKAVGVGLALLLLLALSGTFVRWQARKLGHEAGLKLRGAIQHKLAAGPNASHRPQPPQKSDAAAKPGLAAAGLARMTGNIPVGGEAKAPATQAAPVSQASMTPAPRAAATPAGSVARTAQADAGFQDEDLGILRPTVSQYAYNPDNRRDPFQSLVSGDFEVDQGENGRPMVDVGDLELRGVMTGNNELYAMMEDSKHHGYTLRVGDPVINGRVTRIESNCVTFNLSSYGENETVRLRLKPQSPNGK